MECNQSNDLNQKGFLFVRFDKSKFCFRNGMQQKLCEKLQGMRSKFKMKIAKKDKYTHKNRHPID